MQARTSEARRLLETSADVGVGGATDIRPLADLARHGGVLAPNELLQVKATLVAARTVARTFERLGGGFPGLWALVGQMPLPFGLIDAISRAISERGDVLDSASGAAGLDPQRDESIATSACCPAGAHGQRPANPRPCCRKRIITQRNGRYVIPLRAEFKGQIRSIVHDQSSSGATLFVEPLAVVELNNHWRELQLAERDEERRILAELSHQVGAQAARWIERGRELWPSSTWR